MPSTIQQVPATLLDQLGIKSLGVNPAQLGDLVSGQIDLTFQYLANRLEVVEVRNAGVSVAGAFAAVVIPDAEIWLVKSLTATAKDPSANNTRMVPAMLWEFDTLGTTPRVIVAQADEFVSTTGNIDEFNSAVITYHNPTFFLPGTRFRAMLRQATGGGTTTDIICTVAFYRLLV